MTDILQVRRLEVQFGPIYAIRGIDFSVPAGSATALVGPNGAGKSSTLLAIARALPVNAKVSGSIELASSASVSMVPERDKIFTLLSVAENLRAADRLRGHGRVRVDDVYGWFPPLAERRRSLAGNLSGGEQQMLAIGMALLGTPSVLILDEPTLGLAVPVIERMCETLQTMRRDLNLTLLTAEAEVHWVPQLADSAIVLIRGSIVGRVCEHLEKIREYASELMFGLGADGVPGSASS